MNIEDASIVNAERDADPVRWHDYDPNNALQHQYDTLHSAQARHQAERSRSHLEAVEDAAEEEEVERESSISSSGSSQRDGSSLFMRHAAAPSTVSRTSTRMEHDFMEYLDRHPTAVKRMQDRESNGVDHTHLLQPINPWNPRSSSTFPDCGIDESADQRGPSAAKFWRKETVRPALL